MLKQGALLLSAAALAAAGPALATHDVPSQAKTFQSTLVTSYQPCTAPNTTDFSLLGAGACSPPVQSNPACGMGPDGKGKIQLKVVPCCGGSIHQLKVKGSIKGLPAGCEGLNLTPAISVRATTHNCAMSPCTSVEVEYQMPGASCTVSGGECQINYEFSGQVASPGTSIQIHGCALFSGATRTLECGLLFP